MSHLIEAQPEQKQSRTGTSIQGFILRRKEKETIGGKYEKNK
jgi:hypothetical protein